MLGVSTNHRSRQLVITWPFFTKVPWKVREKRRPLGAKPLKFTAWGDPVGAVGGGGRSWFFWGTPKLLREGKIVVPGVVHANAPCFSSYQWTSPPFSKPVSTPEKYFWDITMLSTCPPGGGGWLSLGINCETTAPFFDKGQPLVLQSPNLQPPIFMDTQEQPLEINVKWWIFSIVYHILPHYCFERFQE